MYKPNFPYNVKAQILKATTEKKRGVVQKTFVEGATFFCSCKGYGGTEKVINDKYVIEDTLIVETYYRNDISGQDKILLLDDNSEWEILSNPENIDRLNKWLKFKVRRISGGV